MQGFESIDELVSLMRGTFPNGVADTPELVRLRDSLAQGLEEGQRDLTEDDLHEALLETLSVLRKAFPDGVRDPDYMPLLVVMGEELSRRNRGMVVEVFLGVNRHIAEHDSVATETTEPPPPEAVDRIRAALVEHGWGVWSYP